jgi:diguanylate cyclase (GGDEF)-like protein
MVVDGASGIRGWSQAPGAISASPMAAPPEFKVDNQDNFADQPETWADYGDTAAHQRDTAAHQRDETADEWDLAASLHDRAAEVRERRISAQGPGSLESRQRAVAARTDAAASRGRAAQDRGAAAVDRQQADMDRRIAIYNRQASSWDRERAKLDDLTGVYTRGAGLRRLDHKVALAAWCGQSLVLAFLDVDHLKDINDSRGHTAGDQLLRELAAALRSRVRASDLIFRYGGDEFVCAGAGLRPDLASVRLAAVNAALTAADDRWSITFGITEYQPGDKPKHLLIRADDALYDARGHQRPNQLHSG